MVGKHTTWELTLRKHTSNPSFINFFVSFLPSTFTLLRMLKLKRNPWARIAPHVVRGNATAMNFGRILDNVIRRVDKSKATLASRRCGPSPKGVLSAEEFPWDPGYGLGFEPPCFGEYI